jgi:hypothetical protein
MFFLELQPLNIGCQFARSQNSFMLPFGATM